MNYETTVVIPGCALTQARNPYSLQGLWIPGSRFARPGMTKEFAVNLPLTADISRHRLWTDRMHGRTLRDRMKLPDSSAERRPR